MKLSELISTAIGIISIIVVILTIKEDSLQIGIVVGIVVIVIGAVVYSSYNQTMMNKKEIQKIKRDFKLYERIIILENDIKTLKGVK